MFRQSRLFASKAHPFLDGLDTTERISIATSDGEISFTCPPASSWRESLGIHLGEIDLSDKAAYSPPNSQLDYTGGIYSYVTVFQRDWTLYGSTFTKEPVAVMCLSINIVDIHSTDPAGLFGTRCPETISYSEHESMLGGGYIDGLYSYSSYYRHFRSGRAERRSFRFTLSETKMLVFDFVQTNPPGTAPYDFDTLPNFAGLVLDSISMKFDKELLARRTAVLSAYAHSHGGHYDSHAQILSIPRKRDLPSTGEEGVLSQDADSEVGERQ